LNKKGFTNKGVLTEYKVLLKQKTQWDATQQDFVDCPLFITRATHLGFSLSQAQNHYIHLSVMFLQGYMRFVCWLVSECLPHHT